MEILESAERPNQAEEVPCGLKRDPRYLQMRHRVKARETLVVRGRVHSKVEVAEAKGAEGGKERLSQDQFTPTNECRHLWRAPGIE